MVNFKISIVVCYVLVYTVGVYWFSSNLTVFVYLIKTNTFNHVSVSKFVNTYISMENCAIKTTWYQRKLKLLGLSVVPPHVGIYSKIRSHLMGQLLTMETILWHNQLLLFIKTKVCLETMICINQYKYKTNAFNKYGQWSRSQKHDLTPECIHSHTNPSLKLELKRQLAHF